MSGCPTRTSSSTSGRSAAFAACAEVETPVFAYAGNPDHYSIAARLKHPGSSGFPTATLRNRAQAPLWQGARTVASRTRGRAARRPVRIASSPTPTSTRHGPPARVLSPEHVAEARRGARRRCRADGNDRRQHRGAVRHREHVRRAGSSARRCCRQLDRLLGDDYEVHLYGTGHFSGGSPRPDAPASRTAASSTTSTRSFRSAKVFLLANNANPDFVVGHTRVLHAWSLGSCLVAHANMATRDARDRARRERAARRGPAAESPSTSRPRARDDALRARIAEGGRAHVGAASSRPEVVGKGLDRRIESYLRLGSASPAGRRPTPARR